MFNGIQKAINNLPDNLYLLKIVFSENISIKKKKKIFSNISWSNSQQNEFKDFWSNNYGKTIKPWWNKLYESMNGVYHKDYFPEMFYSTKLEPIINPTDYCRIFDNKSLIKTIYSNVEGVTFPNTYLMCCNGTYTDGNHNLLTKDKAIESLSNLGECVIKPTVETGSGSGVLVLNMQNGKDVKTNQSATELISKYGKNFIVQSKIINSKEFSALNPSSINTIRLITYIVEDEVHNVIPVMRIGVGKNEVENIHKGGLCIGVNDDGTLKEKAYQLGYGDKTITYTKHPDTGIEFKGYYIGDIQKMISVAKKMHATTPHVGMISWDFTMDENDNIVMIESNCRGQSVWFPQIVNECPIFGEDTPYMIQKMRSK